MRVHYLQHVPFEGLGSIEPVLCAQGHQLSATHLYANQSLPSIDNIDCLIVMGGPMGIYDENAHPWLAIEKSFIKAAIDAGKPVLGICLGAQLIAEMLGAKVYKNPYREIGWFSVHRSSEIENTAFASVIPEQFQAFHWHGDTFDIPDGAVALGSSEACKNQGFIFDGRVVALQFHLETTLQSATALIEHCGDELDGSQYGQLADTMLGNPQYFTEINRIMAEVLNKLLADRGEV